VKGSVAAILLAAGKSRRMGSCKQLLPLGEKTVIARCLDTLLAGGVTGIVVVVAEAGNEVAAAVQDYPARIVVNPEGAGDMASSVRTGRAALATEASGVIVALCDYPLVLSATISRLLSTHRESPDDIIIPCHREEHGHPLLFPRTILEELADHLILRDLVRREPARIRCLAVDDPGVLLDMDTPDDYRRICSLIKETD
jgi:molybdenum cofactor cytidylyltransferase